MRHLFSQSVSAVFLLFGAVVACLLMWIAYRPEIQAFLFAAWESTCGWTW